MSGRNQWCDRNVAERLTFTSFTSDPDDQWGTDSVKRPYAILALEGYEIPPGLDRASKDALWLDKAPAEPLVVWDGFCPHALYEVIYECFGFTPGKTAGKITVAEVTTDPATGEMTFNHIPDTRSGAVLTFRPKKPAGLGRNAYHNRMGDVYAWACIFLQKDAAGRHHDGGGSETLNIYSDFFTNAVEGEMANIQSEDSLKYKSYKARLNGGPDGRKDTSFLRRGSPGCHNDADVVRRELSDGVREDLRKGCPSASQLAAMSSTPRSLYEFSLPSSRDSVTGSVRGAEQCVLKQAEEVMGWNGNGEISSGISLSGERVDQDEKKESLLAWIINRTRRF